MATDSTESEGLGNGTIHYIRRGDDFFIKFPHMIAEASDIYGPCRWNEARFVRDRVWATNTALEWLMVAMLANYSSISHPRDILYVLPAGNPHINDDQKLKDIERPVFQPSLGKHEIIFRLINMGNYHWVAVVHFHTINSIIIFNPLASASDDNPGSEDHTIKALENHAKFVQGSAAVPTVLTEPFVAPHSNCGIKDGWSCGLWCVGLARTLLGLISEHRALHGYVNCTEVRNALLEAMKRQKITRLEVGEARRLARRAWVLQQAPEIKFL